MLSGVVSYRESVNLRGYCSKSYLIGVTEILAPFSRATVQSIASEAGQIFILLHAGKRLMTYSRHILVAQYALTILELSALLRCDTNNDRYS